MIPKRSGARLSGRGRRSLAPSPMKSRPERGSAMIRAADSPPGTYSTATALQTGLMVKCPRCGGPGAVTADPQAFHFRCERCRHVLEKPRAACRRKVENLCPACGRYYRVHLPEETGGFPVLRVACPYCGHELPGRVQQVPSGWYSSYGGVQRGREPFFGLELWFLSSFRGKPIWALDREHLAWLIDYVAADLRVRPPVGYLGRMQSDHLPTFMKTAKNRAGILRCLKRMQEKQKAVK